MVVYVCIYLSKSLLLDMGFYSSYNLSSLLLFNGYWQKTWDSWMRAKGFFILMSQQTIWACYIISLYLPCPMWVKSTAQVHACPCNRWYYKMERLSVGNPLFLWWGASKPAFCLRWREDLILLGCCCKRNPEKLSGYRTGRAFHSWHTQKEDTGTLKTHGGLTLSTLHWRT